MDIPNLSFLFQLINNHLSLKFINNENDCNLSKVIKSFRYLLVFSNLIFNQFIINLISIFFYFY